MVNPKKYEKNTSLEEKHEKLKNNERGKPSHIINDKSLTRQENQQAFVEGRERYKDENAVACCGLSCLYAMLKPKFKSNKDTTEVIELSEDLKPPKEQQKEDRVYDSRTSLSETDKSQENISTIEMRIQTKLDDPSFQGIVTNVAALNLARLPLESQKQLRDTIGLTPEEFEYIANLEKNVKEVQSTMQGLQVESEVRQTYGNFERIANKLTISEYEGYRKIQEQTIAIQNRGEKSTNLTVTLDTKTDHQVENRSININNVSSQSSQLIDIQSGLIKQSSDSHDIRDAADTQKTEVIDKSEAAQQEVNNWPLETVEVRKIEPRPRTLFRDFPTKDVSDFETLAQKLESAVKQMEGPPEDIYILLQPLHHEKGAVDELDLVFRRPEYGNGKGIEEVLRSRFGKPESQAQLEHALQLIDKGEKAIGGIPSTQAGFEIAAMCIKNRLATGKHEMIYKELTALQRNTNCVSDLASIYRETQGRNLIADLKSLPGKSSEYALYLIGDQKLETKVLKKQEAMSLWKASQQLTFDCEGESVSIPYKYLKASCQHRHYAVSQMFKERGITSKTLIAFNFRLVGEGKNQIKQADLRKITHLAPDGKDAVVWGYHTADCVEIETEAGIQGFVWDPIFPQPQIIKNWMAEMGVNQDAFEKIDLKDLQAKMVEERSKYTTDDNFKKEQVNAYPADHAYVLEADRNCYELPTPNSIKYFLEYPLTLEDPLIPDSDALGIYEQRGKAALSKNAAYIPYYEVASYIRQNRQSIEDGTNTEEFFNYIEGVHDRVKERFSKVFPKDYADLAKHFPPTAVERFRTLLPEKPSASQ